MLHFVCLSLSFDHIKHHPVVCYASNQSLLCIVMHSSDYSILSMLLIIFEEGPLTAHLREEFSEEVGVYEN